MRKLVVPWIPRTIELMESVNPAEDFLTASRGMRYRNMLLHIPIMYRNNITIHINIGKEILTVIADKEK